MSSPHFEPSGLTAAEAAFSCGFPDFDPEGAFAALRSHEYGRLDEQRHVYLDYTGGGLYASSQIETHAALLGASVLGNPHSNNPTSVASSALVAEARRAVLDFFNAPADEYLCIFTANASAALRLVGEAYPFHRGGAYALTSDNHNSVNGIREFARRAGARITYVPVVAPDLRLDRDAMSAVLRSADPSAHNLLAFPAQSNFSGVQHPLALVEEARDAGWDVLLDAAAFAATNRLDVAQVRPDFVTCSMYKIIGFPTGIGCLLMRRDRSGILQRPWFSGGTVTASSVLAAAHRLHDDEAAFEDGTVDYLNLPAVITGLEHIARVDLDAIHGRVATLTRWLLDALSSVHHADGSRLVRILGPNESVDRGGTIAFVMHDVDGGRIDDRRVEEVANSRNISLRTGCFCNPGASEIAHGLRADELATRFAIAARMPSLAARDWMHADGDGLISAIRISIGVATNFADVFRFMCFVQFFADRSHDDIASLKLTCSPQQT